MDEIRIDEATPEDEAEAEEEEIALRGVSDRHIIYQDKKGEWRWRRIARNNRIIAVSGEGYKNLNHCFAMVKRICGGAPLDQIRFETQAACPSVSEESTKADVSKEETQ